MNSWDHHVGCAAPSQCGYGAELRVGLSEQLERKDRRTLNDVVHAGDSPFRPDGSRNPFFDPTRSFDPRAQKMLDLIAKKYQYQKDS